MIYKLIYVFIVSFQVTQIHSSVEHNHAAVDVAVSVARARSKMKELATTCQGRPNQILSQVLLDSSETVRTNIGNLASSKRSIRRTRRGALPKDPDSLSDFVLPDEWQTTGGDNPRPFLIHDSGPDSRDRIVVFASQRSLQLLARSHTWFMYGTFSVAPSIFTQLYVIRAPIGTSAVSCVYALLSGKQQSMYEELLQAVLTKCEEYDLYPDPTTVITDFEKAALQAVTSVLGDHVSTQGCFYHLTQSTWRKVQELGLTNLYRESGDVRSFVGMMDGLAFLPMDRVSDGMQFLRENIPDQPGLDDLLSYFDSTYVTGTYCRMRAPADPDRYIPSVNFRRVPPQFPPPLWNTHIATLNDQARTNNLCESWNVGFQQLIGHSHPSVWMLINALRKDLALVDTAILQDQNGQPPRKRVKRATQQLQTRLRTLCQDFVDQDKEVGDFLRSVSHNIRLV